jgi:O-acetylserine/cysteine efflux transporter
MKPFHLALAVLVAAIWGFNFVAIAVGIGNMPPLILAALRFVTPAIMVLFVPRPALSWPRMAAIASTLFIGQFALLFIGMDVGMPAGLASILLQVQGFFTIVFAAAVLGERPSGQQIGGAAVALVGLLMIAATAGEGGFTLAGLALIIAAAMSWAIGNVLLKRAGAVDMFALVAWLSLIPPIPLLLLEAMLHGPESVVSGLAGIDALGAAAAIYIGLLSTTVGFAVWGHLIKLYGAGTVAPYSLLVPIFGALSAALVLGERFGALRIAGMVLIVTGLAVISIRRSRGVAPVAT